MKNLPTIPQVGMKVIIKSRPSSWSSGIEGKDGRDQINYPYEMIIEKWSQRETHIAIKDSNDYGWTWEELDEVSELIQEQMKYRFKTLEEFDKEFGQNQIGEYNLKSTRFTHAKFHLAGVCIPDEFSEIIMREGTVFLQLGDIVKGEDNFWTYSAEMLTLNQPEKSIMKTTKAKLLSVHGQGGCTEFNTVIEELLKEKVLLTDAKEFEVPEKYLKRLPDCNKKQLELLKGIGIEQKKDVWNRENTTSGGSYFYITRDSTKGFKFDYTKGNKLPSIYTYPTQEVAEQELKIHRLMMMMRNWARFHNELDNYTPKWKSIVENYGIKVSAEDGATVQGVSFYNYTLFQVLVGSEERAKQMLTEFKKEIEEVLPYL